MSSPFRAGYIYVLLCYLKKNLTYHCLASILQRDKELGISKCIRYHKEKVHSFSKYYTFHHLHPPLFKKVDILIPHISFNVAGTDFHSFLKFLLLLLLL